VEWVALFLLIAGVLAVVRLLEHLRAMRDHQQSSCEVLRSQLLELQHIKDKLEYASVKLSAIQERGHNIELLLRSQFYLAGKEWVD
jgi:hypothetical protein